MSQVLIAAILTSSEVSIKINRSFSYNDRYFKWLGRFLKIFSTRPINLWDECITSSEISDPLPPLLIESGFPKRCFTHEIADSPIT
jgi:hypothetical protein